MIPFYQIVLIIVIAIFAPHISAATVETGSNIFFGIPKYQDCLKAVTQIPYALTPTEHGARSYQLYAEPQFLLPPFTSVNNRYRPRSINQLPKIWRSGSCRIAIMSYGRRRSSVRNSLFSTAWTSIVAQTKPVVEGTNPRSQYRPCGGWAPFVLPHTGEQAAALYVYSAYSPFEDVVNGYMSGGFSIIPPTSDADITGFLGNVSSSNHSLNISGFETVPPVAPQDIKFLD